MVRLAPEKMPEGRIQYVEHDTPGEIWRAGEVNRLRLAEVFVVAKNPTEAIGRWARFAGAIPSGKQLETARGRIVIGRKSEIAKLLGGSPPAPGIAGYTLRCRDAKAFARRCAKAGMQVKGLTVKLPKALGGFWRLR